MNPLELAIGIALAVLLLGVAAYYAWRQWKSVQLLRRDRNLAPDDRRFIWRQIVRRLCGSVLLVLFAGFLVGWFFLEPHLRELWPDEGEPVGPMAEHLKDSFRLFASYWIAALLILLGLLALAVVDLWATAKYGLRHQKQLEEARRALFKEEAARVRRRRSEMN